MADVNGAAALKPSIGIFIVTGNNSEDGSADSFGEGIFQANASLCINGMSSIVGIGSISGSAGERTNTNSISFMGCAALYARPSFPHDIENVMLGTGIMQIIGSINIISDSILIGSGASMDKCYIANIEDYFNDLIYEMENTPVEACYHVHVNRIRENKIVNRHKIYSQKCYAHD